MKIEWPDFVINNKYKKWYETVVFTADARGLGSSKYRNSSGHNGFYTERHHIIPKSLGGNNSKENLVRLTAREHFICHWLLTKMVIGVNRAKMITALYAMRGTSSKLDIGYENKITGRVYAKLREEYSMICSKLNTGKIVSQSTRDKISAANKGRVYSDEVNKSRGRKGRPGPIHSAEVRARIGEASRNRVVTEETREKHRQNALGEKNNFYGKQHTTESMEKMLKYQNDPKVKKAKSERVAGDKNPAKRPEVKAKISAVQKIRLARDKELGVGNFSEGAKLKRKEAQSGKKNGNAKIFKFTNVDRQEFLVTGGFKKFCVSIGTNNTMMLRVLKGKKEDWQGWTVVEVARSDVCRGRSKFRPA